MDTYPHISPTLELRLIKKENKKERRLFKFADPFVRRGGARGGPRGGPGAGPGEGVRVSIPPSLALNKN